MTKLTPHPMAGVPDYKAMRAEAKQRFAKTLAYLAATTLPKLKRMAIDDPPSIVRFPLALTAAQRVRIEQRAKEHGREHAYKVWCEWVSDDCLQVHRMT